jgi:hypothetical protein
MGLSSVQAPKAVAAMTKAAILFEKYFIII